MMPHSIPARISGQLEVAGLDNRNQPLNQIVRRIGIVLQNPSSQLFHLRVWDEVAFGPRNLGLDEEQIRRRTAWAMKATGLEALAEHKPSELSGGQKQCVAIASILAMRPEVLILDEPTASLDVPSTQLVLDTLKTLRDEHEVTIVIFEHRLADVAQLADRMLLMGAGKILADGTPERVLADQERRNQLGLRRLTREPQTAWEALIEMDCQHANGRKPLLTLENVSAGYDRRAVVHGIDLRLYPGDFIALVGDNGAGKSTLGMVAAGLLKPLQGKVYYENGAAPRPGRDVAMLFQNPAEQLFTDSIDEEIAFVSQNYCSFDPDHHDRILHEADLATIRERRPLAVSVGQQQRTALGACLGLQPRLLVLDEPTLGQDWGHLQRLMDYLTLLNRQGTAILLISHDYKLVHHYAHRVFIIKGGRIHMAGCINRSHESDQSMSAVPIAGELYETINT
jgi:energy-coupling factor transport system ATP-binding protein